jgi:hypothetical protein
MGCYLKKDVWETDVARFGIDIWMTTVAIAEGFRVCQSFLGAKLHDAKDPGADLSAMLQQVVSSVFDLMQEYESAWQTQAESKPVPLFGFRFEVGLEPIHVDVERMLREFLRGAAELGELWRLGLQPDTLLDIHRIASAVDSTSPFHLEDSLWTKVVLEFSSAYRINPVLRGPLLHSLTPLYLARVASFVKETERLTSPEVEERIEAVCVSFETLKPYLLSLWNEDGATQNQSHERTTQDPRGKKTMEVGNV